DIRDNTFRPREGYAFVRRGFPRITADSWEEAQAFFASGELADSKGAYSIGASEAIVGLFLGGRQLMIAQAEWRTGGQERLRLLYKSGLILLEHSSTLGLRRVCFNSLATVRLMAERAAGIVARWKHDPNA